MKSLLKLLVLKLLSEEGRSGYSLIKDVQTNCGLKVSTGSIYPILDEFLTKGLATVVEKKRKKVYFLTEAGKSKAKEISAVHDRIFEKMIGQIMACRIICDATEKEIIEKMREFENEG